ncbi:MAG TPA: hypothetical protein VLK35_02680 [Methylomirabilota bacterium]|nr:hypothetical protein [Methylomirabilota bacterium]
MKGRTLALSLLVYVTLDLANPFMPGAVTFVDGRLEMLDAGRPAGIDLPLPDGPAAVRPSTVEVTPDGPAPPPAPDGARPRRWTPARRALATGPEPASPADDH